MIDGNPANPKIIADESHKKLREHTDPPPSTVSSLHSVQRLNAFFQRWRGVVVTQNSLSILTIIAAYGPPKICFFGVVCLNLRHSNICIDL